MPTPNIYDEERARILAQVPAAPDAAAIAQGQAMRTRDHGHIPPEAIALWKSIIADETNSYAHRVMIWRTSKDALARIGVDWDVPEPSAASARGKE